jgi:uncharacterized protein YyaL (SSP411 family)
MANQLAGEKSPYLLQHADNPVDWNPWSREALERAHREGRPILLSIGYSACHWCHVMAHESFEDRETARLMNESFVNIKVDREERPDVDAIYMEAVQAMTGQGGWPLNVFLTPDGRPFFGGTYFPPTPRHGLPAWRQVLQSVAAAFRERADAVESNAVSLTDYLQQMQRLAGDEGEISASAVVSAYRRILTEFDRVFGGIGSAPKFPQPLPLDFVLRMASQNSERAGLDLVALTLDRMAEGGIYDQLGGGFHRYSVDADWLVPHFEKMLYDNALLALTYLHALQVTRSSAYRRVAEETLDYILRDLGSPEGGFYSAQDADSEGAEGKYYVWTLEELRDALPPDQADIAARRYGVTPGGNFEGHTILTEAARIDEIATAIGADAADVAASLAEVRTTLLSVRERRVHPATDTKILTSWNALAVRALAEAGAVLGRPDYLNAARRCVGFLLTGLRPEGELVRSYRGGPSAIPGFLEDFAYLAEALITLYECTGNLVFLDSAEEHVTQATDRFWDGHAEMFFDAAASDELIVRPRSLFDNPIPSGNASMISALLRLEAITGEGRYQALANRALRIDPQLLERAAPSLGYLLGALDLSHRGALQIAIVPGQEGTAEAMARAVFDRYLPNRVLAIGAGDRPGLLAGRTAREGKATGYLCEHFVCSLPVTDPDALALQLDGASGREGSTSGS